jgi:transcriptional/translational regulatory protein YebC/TACO1
VEVERAGADRMRAGRSGGIESAVLCSPESFEAVQQALIAAGLDASHAGVVMRPNNRVAVPEEAQETLIDLLEKLDALDDVSDVSHNALLPS